MTDTWRRFFTVRSFLHYVFKVSFFLHRVGLPFYEYLKELESAIDVVERACRLCIDVLNPIDIMALGGDSLMYMVGSALVVDTEIVLGTIGCPNWKADISDGS
ncbi:PREDICTED: putative PAP-specific phosphatase, mitochondrial [Tarenaya hassleriana]|uniref:putative PAP-specific phosphatase, mitochondrial n=1 Tax=Tarenaya hassleriana TaxID=28532 RepID=UPI00053C2BE7|nr:PREDICTED: putative PAP-specific phosphatase, mitochondrial [Tarenaya hassleriana]